MHSNAIYTPQKEFAEKLQRIKTLFKYHEKIGGNKPGKREAGLQILNESAIVLLYAAWENYVEYECAFWATHLIVYLETPNGLPNSIKNMVAGRAQAAKCALDNWKYSGQNWRRETLVAVAKEIFDNHRASPERVDDLIHRTIGYRDISKDWSWQAMSSERAKKRLVQYISIRGALAHTAAAQNPVTLDKCKEFANHLEQLVKRTAQLLEDFAANKLSIECSTSNEVIVQDILIAVYKDIETWQKEDSDKITDQLKKKGLI